MVTSGKIEAEQEWKLYMAGSALSFEASEINVHQVLGVKPDAKGHADMPSTRTVWMKATVAS